jgi:predicted nucleotidyltransferase
MALRRTTLDASTVGVYRAKPVEAGKIRRAIQLCLLILALHGCSVPLQRRYRMGMFDEAVIAEAARRMSAAAPDAQVILFGSHARGDAGQGSDLDFLVVEPAVEDVVAESVRLRRTLRGLGLFADIVVVSEMEAEQWRDVHGSLIHEALSDGRALAA